jgi:hypothetical protein
VAEELDLLEAQVGPQRLQIAIWSASVQDWSSFSSLERPLPRWS